jgi:hypothetical protein
MRRAREAEGEVAFSLLDECSAERVEANGSVVGAVSTVQMN